MEPRAAGTDGSARWALDLAAPHLLRLAPDAQLRQIFSSAVALDGRLGKTGGAWTLVAWSAARKRVVQASVDFTGKVTSGTRDGVAPGPGGVKASLPMQLVDSTVVLDVLRSHLTSDSARIMLIALNVADYGGPVAGQPVWAVSFDDGVMQIVGLDGKYIRAQ